MVGCRTTIAIVERETHSSTSDTLLRVLAASGRRPRVVVVVGGAPRRVLRALEALARSHDATLIVGDAVFSENEAQNLALHHVHTEFVAFVGNDTLVDVGWLARLEQSADETGAAAVVPVVLWGEPEEIHFAGGACHLAEGPGGLRLVSHNELMHRPTSIVATLPRAPSELVELHCVLLRTSVLRHLGSFDEDLVAAREEADLALRLADISEQIVVDPSVVVRYLWPKRLRASDRSFFRARWSAAWGERSFVAFNRKWHVTDTSIDETFHQGHLQRRIGTWPHAGGWTAKARWKARRAVDVVATPLAVRAEDRRRTRAGPARVVHRASWDPTRPGT
jgi:GT2 family glycosyltransferase